MEIEARGARSIVVSNAVATTNRESNEHDFMIVVYKLRYQMYRLKGEYLYTFLGVLSVTGDASGTEASLRSKTIM
jgi:hypothetical protein